MNRLVIIGNGFDLAHGLLTSYKDFINDFWRNLKTEYKNGTYSKFIFIDDSRCSILDRSYQCFNDFKENLKIYSNRYPSEVSLDSKTSSLIGKEGTFKNKPVVEFKNSFFLIINLKDSLNNWVDIENEYYKELKKIVNKNKDENQRFIEIKKLHKEFDEVKELLEIYLERNINQKHLVNNKEFKKLPEFINKFTLKHKDDYYFNYLKAEFPLEDHTHLETLNNLLNIQYNKKETFEALQNNGLLITNLFLNFNYTTTIEKYTDEFSNNSYDYCGENQFIHIHGELFHENNKIIFGFGDEMDDDYSTIEKLDNNEYLRNFKSFQYSLYANYKNLLDFIESNKFQVFIVGHSCGLSDRILLNTIFEHENCRSIKVFYREKDDGTDNYTNLVQNISRHFNNKALMRKKLVNKLLSHKLPKVKQNQ